MTRSRDFLFSEFLHRLLFGAPLFVPDISPQADFSGGNYVLFVAIHVLFQRIDFVQVEKAVAAGEYISTSTTTRNKSKRLGCRDLGSYFSSIGTMAVDKAYNQWRSMRAA